MKKILLILVTALLLIFNLVMPTTVLSRDEAEKLVTEFFNSTLKQ